MQRDSKDEDEDEDEPKSTGHGDQLLCFVFLVAFIIKDQTLHSFRAIKYMH
jgi:hypothetical protein